MEKNVKVNSNDLLRFTAAAIKLAEALDEGFTNCNGYKLPFKGDGAAIYEDSEDLLAQLLEDFRQAKYGSAAY